MRADGFRLACDALFTTNSGSRLSRYGRAEELTMDEGAMRLRALPPGRCRHALGVHLELTAWLPLDVSLPMTGGLTSIRSSHLIPITSLEGGAALYGILRLLRSDGEAVVGSASRLGRKGINTPASCILQRPCSPGLVITGRIDCSHDFSCSLDIVISRRACSYRFSISKSSNSVA